MTPERTILVPIDFSDTTKHALAWALYLARRERASLRLLHVMRDPEYDAWSPVRLSPEQRVLRDDPAVIVEVQAAKMLAALDADGVDVEVDSLRGDSIVKNVLRYADQIDADLIVVGTHGRKGIQRWVLGSVAEEIVRQAPVPVLVVPTSIPEPPDRPVRRILMPVDFTVAGEAAFAEAEAWARRHQATLVVQHILEGAPPAEIYGTEYAPVPSLTTEMITQARTVLAHRVERAKADGVAVVEQHLDEGEPGETILETAYTSNTDLIVMGTHARKGFERFLLGSVAERVLRRACCPVLVVRSRSQGR